MYARGFRRYLLVDEWTSLSGSKSESVFGRAWTRRGAKFQHAVMAPFLRPRGGQASVLLVDQKTGHRERLSTQ
jgi:hypothetical protein